MCYDKYAKELGDREFGDGLLIYEEAEPKTVELKFVANARKGGTNWKKFSKESDKKKMGKPHEAVPLIIPYTIVANGKQFRKDCVHWDDAIKFRRTTQLAYLTMFKDSLPDIDDVCAGLRIRRPDSHIFFVIKLAVDDTTNYAFQVIDNFTKLLRALNNGQKIDRWHDEYVKIGKNEFIDEYNSIAKVLHRIEKKHGATFKFEAEKLA